MNEPAVALAPGESRVFRASRQAILTRWALLGVTTIWFLHWGLLLAAWLGPVGSEARAWALHSPAWGALQGGAPLLWRSALALFVAALSLYLPLAWTRTRADRLVVNDQGLCWGKTCAVFHAGWGDVVAIYESRHRRLPARRLMVKIATLNPWKRYLIIDYGWERFADIYDLFQERAGFWVEKSRHKWWGF